MKTKCTTNHHRRWYHGRQHSSYHHHQEYLHHHSPNHHHHHHHRQRRTLLNREVVYKSQAKCCHACSWRQRTTALQTYYVALLATTTMQFAIAALQAKGLIIQTGIPATTTTTTTTAATAATAVATTMLPFALPTSTAGGKPAATTTALTQTSKIMRILTKPIMSTITKTKTDITATKLSATKKQLVNRTRAIRKNSKLQQQKLKYQKNLIESNRSECYKRIKSNTVTNISRSGSGSGDSSSNINNCYYCSNNLTNILKNGEQQSDYLNYNFLNKLKRSNQQQKLKQRKLQKRTITTTGFSVYINNSLENNEQNNSVNYYSNLKNNIKTVSNIIFNKTKSKDDNQTYINNNKGDLIIQQHLNNYLRFSSTITSKNPTNGKYSRINSTILKADNISSQSLSVKGQYNSNRNNLKSFLQSKISDSHNISLSQLSLISSTTLSVATTIPPFSWCSLISFLPGAIGGSGFTLPPLKVNQVFENERQMSSGQIRHNRGRIVLLGLFELSTKYGPRPDGLSELGAALMAVEHINRKHILPGYTLELVTNDTQCDPGVGVDRFFHALYTQPTTRMVMLLGSACSEVTESLAKVVPYWNIVQVSFGSTSPALSDRQEFPYFYRTVAPDSSHNPARIAFIRHFGWDTVTTFSQNEEVHSLAVNDLVTELEAANISCAATITFAETDFREQLLLLRETDTRIIIGSFSQHLAPKILCEAYKLRMFGAEYAWILYESVGAPWWNGVQTFTTHCNDKELKEAVENLIIVSSHNSIVGNNISLSGLNNDMFYTQLSKKFVQVKSVIKDNTPQTDIRAYRGKQRKSANEIKFNNPAIETPVIFQTRTSGGNAVTFSNTDASDKNEMSKDYNSAKSLVGVNHKPPPLTKIISRYAPQTYDAVWAIALALRAAEEHWRRDAIQSKLDRFDYTRSDMAWEFLKQMSKLNFLGVSGPVSFSGPDRIGTTAFYQVQNGALHPIALFYPAEKLLDFHCPRCRPVKWHGNQVPIARRVFKLRVATVAPLAFYTIATLSSMGITLAIAFLAFNLHFRKLKAIKLSSPKLSNITAVGCILVYGAVVLLGLDYSTLSKSKDSFATVCTARVYLLSAGFSLAFGSMFAKTYRVHRIFTRTGSIFKDKMLQDIQLILLVCCLLLIDGLVVTLWVVTDPMERHLSNLTLEISSVDRSVVYQPQVEVCRSQHTQIWLGVLYAYKGLLLVVGVYMAWETRHVKIAALNDSQYIGVSVYSVVITSAIVVVLANLISERVTLAFVTITVLILTSTTATLCLLFMPKLKDIWARNDIVDPVIHSMGLKMECNTRRFVIDDRRELQYRVEVQNRVYKKEIIALDAEIRKLERMLESGNASTTTSSSTSLKFGQHKPELTITTDSSFRTISPPPLPPPLTHSYKHFNSKSRTPSISGILPNLLLSVLPPVIPRASWPSAEYMQVPMRRSVTFASQPQLEDHTIADSCLPAQDLYNLRLAHQEATDRAKSGLMTRLRGIFSRNATITSSNKDSTNSLTEQKSLKAAFRSHVGLFTRLIPSSQTASCNAIYSIPTGTVTPAGDNASNASLHVSAQRIGSTSCTLHRTSFAKSGTHLDSTAHDPSFLNSTNTANSTIAIISGMGEEHMLRSANVTGLYIKAHATKVNFALPSNRRSSNAMSALQPTLRERVRGSPRFPHRILPPTCSLSALEETQDRINLVRQPPNLRKAVTAGNWKSMEVTTISRLSLNGTQAEQLLQPRGKENQEVENEEEELEEGLEEIKDNEEEKE